MTIIILFQVLLIKTTILLTNTTNTIDHYYGSNSLNYTDFLRPIYLTHFSIKCTFLILLPFPRGQEHVENDHQSLVLRSLHFLLIVLWYLWKRLWLQKHSWQYTEQNRNASELLHKEQTQSFKSKNFSGFIFFLPLCRPNRIFVFGGKWKVWVSTNCSTTWSQLFLVFLYSTFLFSLLPSPFPNKWLAFQFLSQDVLFRET